MNIYPDHIATTRIDNNDPARRIFRNVDELLEFIADMFDARPVGRDRRLGHCSGPLHKRGDRTSSLSISIGRSGKILLHCFAGCSPASILASKGLSFRSLCIIGGGSLPTRAQARAAAAERDSRECKRQAWNRVERAAAWHMRESWRLYAKASDRVVAAGEGAAGDAAAVAFHQALDRLRWAEAACEKLAAERKRVEKLDDFYFKRLRQLRAAKVKVAS